MSLLQVRCKAAAGPCWDATLAQHRTQQQRELAAVDDNSPLDSADLKRGTLRRLRQCARELASVYLCKHATSDSLIVWFAVEEPPWLRALSTRS